MKKHAFYLVLAFIVIGLVLSGCQRDRGDGRVVLRLGAMNPAEDLSVQAMERMARAAYEKSGGTLQIQVFPAGQLGASALVQLEAVSMGTQDMVIDTSSWIGTFYRDKQVDGIFFAFRDRAHYSAYLNSPLNLQMEEGFRRATGIRVIGRNWYRLPRSFVSRTPFDADTFQGMMVRVPDIPGFLQSVAAMGGNPTMLAWTEIYLGLMQGVVDAAEGPFEALYTNRFHEAVDYITLTHHMWDNMLVFINDGVWNRLSPEHRQILLDVSHEAGEWYSAQLLDLYESIIQAFRNAGATVIDDIDVRPFQERVGRRALEIEAAGTMWRSGLWQEIQNIH